MPRSPVEQPLEQLVLVLLDRPHRLQHPRPAVAARPTRARRCSPPRQSCPPAARRAACRARTAPAPRRSTAAACPGAAARAAPAPRRRRRGAGRRTCTASTRRSRHPAPSTSTGACGVRCTPSTYSSAPTSCAASAMAGMSGRVPSRFDAPVTATTLVRLRRAPPGSRPPPSSPSPGRTRPSAPRPRQPRPPAPTAGCSSRGRAGSRRPGRPAPTAWRAPATRRTSPASPTARRPPRRRRSRAGRPPPGGRRRRPPRRVRSDAVTVPRLERPAVIVAAIASATCARHLAAARSVEVGDPLVEGREVAADASPRRRS